MKQLLIPALALAALLGAQTASAHQVMVRDSYGYHVLRHHHRHHHYRHYERDYGPHRHHGYYYHRHHHRRHYDRDWR